MTIELINVSRSFGAYQALKEVSLRIEDGELTALLGPSGSGKTTLLRIIAGLELPDRDNSSAILFHGQDVSTQPIGRREVGFVFQHYALFKHMNVFENIAFGLRVRPKATRPSQQAITDKVERLLDLVQLDGFARRFPSQLSGGQRQRVALARALAVEPKFLLLDEPFGALDAKVRQSLRSWLRRLHEELHMTTILVTHDQEEALEVADRVVVMNKARIEQVGTPEDVFHRPASEFVIDFLGKVNVFQARLQGGNAHLRDWNVSVPVSTSRDSEETNVYVRPHELDIQREHHGVNTIPATIDRISPAGPHAKILLTAPGGSSIHVDMSFEEFSELNLRTGDSVFISPRRCRAFVPDFAI